jgi:hypothetical protein
MSPYGPSRTCSRASTMSASEVNANMIGRIDLWVHALALLWQILSGAGFPNQFFCDSWVVGLWRGRRWEAEDRIGGRSLDAF